MSSVEIFWPTGKTEVLHDLPADFIYTIVEEQGVRQRTPLPAVGTPSEPASKSAP